MNQLGMRLALTEIGSTFSFSSDRLGLSLTVARKDRKIHFNSSHPSYLMQHIQSDNNLSDKFQEELVYFDTIDTSRSN